MKSIKKVVVLFCIGLLGFITACDKSNDTEPLTLLTKIYNITTTDEITFEYDIQNRITKIKELSIFNSKETQITYSDNGNVTEHIIEDNGEYLDILYSFTSSTITMELGHLYEGELDATVIYNLNSDASILKEQEFHLSNNFWKSSYIKLYTRLNRNSSQVENLNSGTGKNAGTNSLKNNFYTKTDLNLRLKSVNNTQNSITSYEYDNKKNPFLGLGIIWGPCEGYNINNITQVIISYPNLNEEIFNYSYEYNSNKYPTKRTSTCKGLDGSIYTEIAIYEYITR